MRKVIKGHLLEHVVLEKNKECETDMEIAVNVLNYISNNTVVTVNDHTIVQVGEL